MKSKRFFIILLTKDDKEESEAIHKHFSAKLKMKEPKSLHFLHFEVNYIWA